MTSFAQSPSPRERLQQAPHQLFDWLTTKSVVGMPAAAFLNGVLLSRAFAPSNFFVAIFICFPLMILMVQRARNARDAFQLGWWTGLGHFVVGLWWVGYSFTQQGPTPNVPLELAPLAVFFLSVFLSLYIGLAFAIAYRLKTHGLLGILVFAASWSLMELARGFLFTGFPWNIVSSIWANWLPMAQSAYYLGVYGLGFVTVFAAGLFALFFISGTKHSYIVGPLMGVLLFASMFSVGYWRLESNETLFHVDVPIRLVQASVNQRELWVRSYWDDHFDKHINLSRGDNKTGRASGVKLLIWPESGIQEADFDRINSLKRWRLSKLLDFGSYALVSSPRYERADGRISFFNSMMAIGSKADLFARYDKNHLVPFGEYMPLSSLFRFFGLRHLTEGAALTPGTGKKNIELPGVPVFSTLICYEAIFPGEAYNGYERPQWLLNMTNDGWYGPTEGPQQHLALAKMRGIEEGLPLVRSALSGVSMVMDPFGRTISKLDYGRVGALNTVLPQPADQPSVSTNIRIYLLMGLILIILTYTLFARKRNIQNS